MVFARPPFGAPGVYEQAPVAARSLSVERMDIAAFAGVAPRGPANTVVYPAAWATAINRPGVSMVRTTLEVVESFAEYVALYGAFEGPGRLPYAVASFFENGGRRAHIARIVAPFDAATEADDGVARAQLPGVLTTGGDPVWLRAANEGQWGNGLQLRLHTRSRPLPWNPTGTTLSALSVPVDAALTDGAVIRFQLPGGLSEVRMIPGRAATWIPGSGRRAIEVAISPPLPVLPERIEVLEATVVISEEGEEVERFDGLGLSHHHPRWVLRVLAESSGYVIPALQRSLPGPLPVSWVSVDATATSFVVPVDGLDTEIEQFIGGRDRYAALGHDHFFGDWIPGDPYAGDGVHAFTETPELALIVVPDLYVPQSLKPPTPGPAPVSVAGPEFAPCIEVAPPELDVVADMDLAGLHLDPNTDFEKIVELQLRLQELAELLRDPVVLLDVPPQLSESRIERWRSRFDSAFVAAYHPWLRVFQASDARSEAIMLNPSAVACGIIANKDREAGVQFGPANVVAEGVVDLVEGLSEAAPARLHPLGINLFRMRRDGVALLAARTLSRDPQFRQLSVRRLMTMLQRVLHRQMQWVVFEPNTEETRRDLKSMIAAFLRRLHRAQALAGRSEKEAFFVRSDASMNPRAAIDQGRLLVEVGVAPVEPVEFIVLEIRREADETIRVES